jgi:hypothetical protein
LRLPRRVSISSASGSAKWQRRNTRSA